MADALQLEAGSSRHDAAAHEEERAEASHGCDVAGGLVGV